MAAKFGSPVSIKGVDGSQGPRGISILTGDGTPTPDIGNNGDSYIDLLTGDLFSPKGDGGWGNAVRNLTGPQGGIGPIGPSGKALLNGYQAPADTLGDDGDSYFCQQNGSVYGPKQDGTWGVSPTSIVGPPGPGGSQGTIIYPVSDVPDDTMGRDGDFAIDTEHHTYYGPKFGTWGNPVDLVGPIGETGAIGPQGNPGVDGATFLARSGLPNSVEGKVGDYWLDQTGSIIYGPKNTDPNTPWPTQGFSFRGAEGPAGPVGPAGFMGQNGRSFIIADTDPTTDDGSEGDTWFNKVSGYIYGPKTSGSWDLTHGDLIQGAKGDKGDVGDVGPQGLPGIGFLTGTDAPSDSVGNTGQYYYASDSFTIYGPKNSNGNSSWGPGHTLVGDKGERGDTGADSTVPGPTGPQGTGIYLLNSAPNSMFGRDGDGVITQGGDVYGPKSGGAWGAKIGSLVGPIGPVGPQGPAGNASTVAGPSGLSFLVGSGTPSSSYGNDGDSFFDQVARAIYPNKTMGAWSNPAVSLVGAMGAQGVQGIAGKDGANGTTLRYGNGAPTSSTIANDGDFYIDQTNTRLYGPRANSTWSTSYVPLIGPTGQKGDTGAAGAAGATGATGSTGASGPAGTQITYGTAEPGLTYGNDADFYIRTDTWNLYYKVTHVGSATTPQYPNGWQILGSLRGPQGVTGATGPTGPQGQQGVTGATGTQGPMGNDGGVGPAGPAGATGSAGPAGPTGPSAPGLRSGSDVPSASNPSYQVDGDYYLRTDVSPYLLYGPRANGVWPTTAQNTGGSQTQTGNGPPASTVGAVGDVYYDLTNALFYPPKTSNGWTTAPINMVGPTGSAGFTTLSSQSAGNGISVALSGVALSSTAVACCIPGTSIAAVYAPVYGTQFIGYSITNPGAAVTLSLVNTTTSATVYTVSIAANVTTGNYFSLSTSYTMTAGQNYVWQATGSGTANFCFTPQYLMPSVTPGYNVSNLPTVGISASQGFSSTATQLKYPGTTVGNAYRLPKGGALYAASLYNNSSAAMTFSLNYSTNGGSSYATLYSSSVAANSASSIGPFAPSSYSTIAASVIYWSVTGSGSGTCFADTQILYGG